MTTWRRNFGPFAVLVACALAMPAVMASADQPARAPDIIVRAEKVGASLPLAEIAAAYRDRMERGEVPAGVPTHEINPRNVEVPPFLQNAVAPEGPVDTVVQGGYGVNAVPPPTVNVDGTSSDDNAVAFGFRLAPPDTEGDVGPKHYVEWINLLIEIFDKNGNTVAGPFPGSDLWNGFGGACETGNDGDPIVLYDQFNDRWMMSQFETSGNHQCIAVSQTGDPTGAYWLYDFVPSATYFNDYPKFGIWSDGLYYTANAFTSSLQGILLGAFEYDKMLTGDPAQYIGYFLSINDPDYLYYSFLPADIEGMTPPPAGMPAIFAGMVDDAFGVPPPYNVDGVQLWQMDTDWVTPGNTTFTPLDWIPVAPFDSNMCGGNRNCIPQPGTTTGLDALSNRLMYRLNYRNFGGHQTLTASHTVDTTGTDHAGVRWYELRAPGGGTDWDVYQQGTFAPDSDHRFMGDVNMDGDGNMLIGYTVSSSTVFPSVRVAGRLAGDPLGTMAQGELEIVAGGGVQTGVNRWGDYSTVSVDPVDNCTFWIAQEYVKDGGSFEWETRIAALKFPTCGGPSGTVEGTVTSSATGDPIEGALVSFGGLYSTLTNAAGFYSMQLPVGTYDMTVTKFFYSPGSATGVVVEEGVTTVQDFVLDPVGTAQFDGYVTDAGHGWPLYARIDLSLVNGSAPVATVFTNPFNGYYVTPFLPQGSVYEFLVTPLYPGYVPAMRSELLPPEPGLAVNFTLMPTGDCSAPGYAMGDPLLFQDFEGTFPPAGWTVVDNISPGGIWQRNDIAGDPINRTTGAGGSGFSAAARAEGSGINWDTELRSPPVSLALDTNIEFPSNFQDFAGNGDAWFDVSIDGGSNWINIWYSTVDDPGGTGGGGVLRSFDLSPYTGETARFRWRYAANSGSAWWWQIDNVFIPGTCQPVPGALVGGFVTDANTGMAINGATVESSTGGMTMSMGTPDDPGIPDGWWWLFEALPGLGPSTRTFTASAPNYAPREYEVNVVPDAMNEVGFQLDAGWLEMMPLMIDSRLYPGETDPQLMTLVNHGGLEANVSVYAVEKGIDYAPQMELPAPVLLVPVDQQDLPDASAVTGGGIIPGAGEAPGDPVTSWPSGLPAAWGIAYDAFNGTVWVGNGWDPDLNMYEYTPDGTPTGRSQPFDWTPPFGPGDYAFDPTAGTIWVMNINTTENDNSIYEIDPSTGPTGVKITPGFSTSQRGLAYDMLSDTFFGGSWNDSSVHRFTRDGTILESVNVGIGISGLAYNPGTGHLFAMDNASGVITVLDVNASYGVVTTFPTGIGSGAGLEMDCAGNLWAVDQADEMVYALESGEAGFCPFLGGLPWLELDPLDGVVPGSEGTHNFTAEFIADGTWHFGLHKAEIVTLHDTPYEVPNVGVYFTKAFWDIPAGYWADAYIHALAGIRVTFGCGFGNFCPDQELARKHMAIFLVRMTHGADFKPPTAVGIFVDVPIEDYSTIADYIEQIYNDGIAAGCLVVGDDKYFCPDAMMSRAEMAVLICRARGWDPIPWAGTFSDVPEDHWAAGYIERIYAEGVTAGCGGGLFCEGDPITRAEIAVFLIKAWGVEYFIH